MIGVYKITNNTNNKSYIGISVDIEHRWKDHKLPYNWSRESNKVLYQAFIKYGIQNFTFEVLEECERASLNDRETHYIQFYEAQTWGYNMNRGGSKSYGKG